MKLSLPVYRRMLFIYAAVVVAVALVLVLGVIGPVKDEVAIGATPQKAVQAFWVNIGVNLLAGLALILIAFRSKGRSWISISLHIIIGLIVLSLGLAADAASAYKSHGSSMQTAVILIYICAAADFLTGALVVTTAFLQPKRA